jgi:hypothetical protein
MSNFGRSWPCFPLSRPRLTSYHPGILEHAFQMTWVALVAAKELSKSVREAHEPAGQTGGNTTELDSVALLTASRRDGKGDRRVVALLAILLAACHAGTESSTTRPVTVAIDVADSSGAASPGTLVVHLVWPQPTIPATPPDPDDRTDASGRIWIRLGSYPDGAFDSLRLRIQTRGCAPRNQYDVTLPATALVPAGEDTVVARVVIAEVSAPASTTPGEYCAFGVHPQWGPLGEYTFHLRVASAAGGTIHGEWTISHSASYGTEEGTFAGIATDALVALDLVNLWPELPCEGSLRGAVQEDGSWGPLVFHPPEACEGAPRRLDFAVVP